MEIALLDDKVDSHLNGTMRSSSFTVIIPAYNEERRITPVLEGLCRYIEKHRVPWKVTVMIDGNDGTSDIVGSFSKGYSFVQYVKTEERGGKGSAIKRAADLVDSDFVILMDADNSVSLGRVVENVQLLEENDVVILSRYLTSNSEIPFLRRVISRGFNLALKVLLDLRINDTQSGYKLFRASVFKEAMSKVTTTNTFYDVAMLYYLNEEQAKILEIPVPYEHNSDSTFHPIGEVIGQGVSLIAFKIRHTKLFEFIPEFLTNLYYRKFRWM